jgi:hypothetical protein
MASVLARFICDTCCLAVANIGAKFLAARLIRREPAVRARERA